MIANENEAKTMTKHISCDCKYKFNSATCNSNKEWNNETCLCACKDYLICQKDYKAAMETNFRLKKNASGLVQRNDPECFVIINQVLSNTNGGINAICSGPLDTSLVNTNMDEFIIKNKVGETIKYNDASSDNKKVKVNIFVKTLGETPFTDALIKLLKVPKTKKS